MYYEHIIRIDPYLPMGYEGNADSIYVVLRVLALKVWVGGTK